MDISVESGKLFIYCAVDTYGLKILKLNNLATGAQTLANVHSDDRGCNAYGVAVSGSTATGYDGVHIFLANGSRGLVY